MKFTALSSMFSGLSNITLSYETSMPMSGGVQKSGGMCDGRTTSVPSRFQSKNFDSLWKYVFLGNDSRLWLLGKLNGHIGEIFLSTVHGQDLFWMRADRSQTGSESLLLQDQSHGTEYHIKRIGNGG